jgi:hypothetical protein
MRGNIVVAAAVFGGSLIVASLILVFGVRWAADGAMVRFESAVAGHGRSVEQGGLAAGTQVKEGVAGMSNNIAGLSVAVGRHAESLERAGNVLARPVIGVKGPVSLAQPLRVEGTGDGGVLPVEPRVIK